MIGNRTYAALLLLCPGLSQAGLIYGNITGPEATPSTVTVKCPAGAAYSARTNEAGAYEVRVPENDVPCTLTYKSKTTRIYSYSAATRYDFRFDGELKAT